MSKIRVAGLAVAFLCVVATTRPAHADGQGGKCGEAKAELGSTSDPAMSDAVAALLDEDLLQEDGAGLGDDKAGIEQAAYLRKECDRDGDGRLEGEERSLARSLLADRRERGLRQEFAKLADQNHDGALSDDEQAMLDKKLAEREARREEYHRKLHEKFDADGDGELNADERKSLRTAWKENCGKRGDEKKECEDREKEKTKEHAKDKDKEKAKAKEEQRRKEEEARKKKCKEQEKAEYLKKKKQKEAGCKKK